MAKYGYEWIGTYKIYPDDRLISELRQLRAYGRALQNLIDEREKQNGKR